MEDSLALARFCRDVAVEGKAIAPVILDLRNLSAFTDFFLICSAASPPQLKALVASLEREVQKVHGLQPRSLQGSPASHWVVVDYGSLLVHIFLEKERAHYELERLWGDAPVV
ncbi:Ribosomal silencing factor RsfS [Methylacidimicrobium cyclopophantes]|uniref:Ribosomal silencing factor RsfS n=1 Tax=Methylacidimicrobium cyclopophantes TaxID=1041766 RepID=A0A5E6MC81_9BACT|nr:ribosome silencing factor [Methylacidimicrobium cyclopophantes]VVM06530.1 Ribosomal silencing factor RsfS [Methylacidimicrobium cyclopophantes]